MITLSRNHYELNDNVFPFLSFLGDKQDGEFYTVSDTNKLINRFPTRQNTVLTNLYSLDGQETEHKRDVYNFLFVLADIGGV